MTGKEFNLSGEEVDAAPSQEETTGNGSLVPNNGDLLTCFSLLVCLSLLPVYVLVLFNFAAMSGRAVRRGSSC